MSAQMREEDVVLLTAKGIVSDLPPQDRHQVEACARQMRALIAAHGEHGQLALALVAAEAAAA